MPSAVYLHVGAPKTGTTYLQHVLWNNRRALAEDGVCYPGNRSPAHFWAAQDLRQTRFNGNANPNVPGAWGRLVDEVSAWNGPVAIIDHEQFSPATTSQIDRALTDLSFAEVHLVYTVRDLARQIPAVWQESVKNGETATFAEFLTSIVRDADQEGSIGRSFWRRHDYPGVLARWARDLPPERVHVVTVPPPGAEPGLLWERFATVVGLDPSRYDTAVPRANASLGAAEAAVIRRLNVALDEDGVGWPAYRAAVKGFLAQRVLEGRPDRRSVRLPDDQRAWATERSREVVKEIDHARYDVVGDLDELVPTVTPPTGTSADDVPTGDQLDASAVAMAALVKRVSELRERSEWLRRRVERAEAEAAQLRQRLGEPEQAHNYPRRAGVGSSGPSRNRRLAGVKRSIAVRAAKSRVGSRAVAASRRVRRRLPAKLR